MSSDTTPLRDTWFQGQSEPRSTPNITVEDLSDLPRRDRVSLDQRNQQKEQDGRVLLINFVGQDHVEHKKLKVEAQEFDNLKSLQRFYDSPKSRSQTTFRVIHVQSAPWAIQFLLNKFNICHCNDHVGTEFGRWARYEKAQQHTGKPVLKGKAFRTQRDPSRGINRTSFALDYLKHYPVKSVPDSAVSTRMMELDHHDATNMPSHGYDVFSQRLSVYVQHKEAQPMTPTVPNVSNPRYHNEAGVSGLEHSSKQHGSGSAGKGRKLASIAEPVHLMLDVNSLDNGRIIIIFDHSHSGVVEDTLIGARQEIVSRWRRLTFNLPQEDVVNDEAHLRALAGDEGKEDWLETAQAEFEKLANLVEQTLITPTDKLMELMYQSVQIRDSRHNLELGMSVWRLSWITFIFLPLTFLVGFFDIDPSRKDRIKCTPPPPRIGDPTRRGVYEHEFHSLSNAYPQLWTRAGPRTNIEPQGFSSRMKWRLILNWYAPNKTTLAPSYELREEIGVWSRFKRYLVWRWLGQMKFVTASSIANVELGKDSILGSNPNTNHVLNPFVTPLTATEAQPPNPYSTTSPSRHLRPASASSGPSRPSSAASTGVMIEEARFDTSDDEILSK
ncbi:hypothetical protein H2199_000762 [Coniosporium tulheliwenetii]|uniref:Uncharacterized protein n=1 Tax=Coniosporium tulheliwenetii TaxID=3383036 RepID=A0ACC2ZMR5_9PEZI|nr:hypothetical protein H2199_000762 [Cladosporium sp. JES 115]